MRSRSRISRATTRLGGPEGQSGKALATSNGRSKSQSDKLLAKAGLLAGQGPAARCSPYMFYHGGEITYEDGSQNEKTTKKKKTEDAPAETPSKPLDDSDQPTDLSPVRDPRSESALSMVSPPLLLPKAQLAPLEDYDDEFSRGAVLAAIRDLRKRREKQAARKFNDILQTPCAENLVSFQARLAMEVRNDDGSTPAIRRENFINLMKGTYEVESDTLLDLFCREIDRSNEGMIPFTKVMELMNFFVGGEHRILTATACFRVFDVDKRDTLTLRRMKKMRASKPKERYGTSGATFAMIKAVLDLWMHDVTLSTTLSLEQFLPYWDTNEALVRGFMEEIIRTIMVVEFKFQRDKLVPQPDPPTLFACHNGLVPGYNRELISAIP
jgi:hypothetical protein